MFGNMLGWIVSAFIAVCAVIVGYELLLIAQPTAPTGWVQQAVQPLTIADAARGVLEPMNDLQDSAGDLYRHAIADVTGHPNAYTQLQTTRDFDEAQIAERPGFDDLVTAAHCPSMDLFKSQPDQLVGFDTNVDALDKLETIAKSISNIVALARLEKRYDIAEKYANALAALGYHLYAERIADIELTAGESDLGTGIASLIETAQAEGKDARLAGLQAFDLARKTEFDSRIDPVIKVISSQGQQNIGDHAGDMFELAADSNADHVWRVEAIRKIGRLQFNAEKSSDQIKAPKFLARLANDATQDPTLRAAARKAHEMTAYDNQSSGEEITNDEILNNETASSRCDSQRIRLRSPTLMDSSNSAKLKIGQHVRVTQQIAARDHTFISEIHGTVVDYSQKQTGSWYAHSKDDKLWLDRLTLKKPDGELITLNLDEYSVINVDPSIV